MRAIASSWPALEEILPYLHLLFGVKLVNQTVAVKKPMALARIFLYLRWREHSGLHLRELHSLGRLIAGTFDLLFFLECLGGLRLGCAF